MTNPHEYNHLFDDLPSDVDELCLLVQNNLLHVFWAERYGRILSDEEKQTVNLRSISQKLASRQQMELDTLAVPLPLDRRQIGNCRDFTVMLVAILRHQGIPARARCGFGTYFLSDHFEDHWVCEYWNDAERRWILVDAQLDEFQCSELEISFNPLDVPRDQFIIAGQAWQMCRFGQVESQQFGIFDWRGWWFIWGNVVRDLLAFNKVEILPWDILPDCMTHELNDPLPQDGELSLYDGIASLTLAGDLAFPELRACYENDTRFQFHLEL